MRSLNAIRAIQALVERGKGVGTPGGTMNLKRQFFIAIEGAFNPGTSKRLDRLEGADSTAKVYSYKYREALRDTASDFSKFMKAEYPEIKKVNKIKSFHVEAFLNSKQNISDTTKKQYATRLDKLGGLVSATYNAKVDYKVNVISKPQLNNKIRTVKMDRSDLHKVYESTKWSQSKLGVQLCEVFGLRVSEATKIKLSDIDLKNKKLFIEKSKGGRDRTVTIRTKQQMSVVKELERYGMEQKRSLDSPVLTVGNPALNRYLTDNLKKLGITKYVEHKSSIHAVRKMYATDRYLELRKNGLSHRDAWGTVSSELGHGYNRSDLFKTYVVLD